MPYPVHLWKETGLFVPVANSNPSLSASSPSHHCKAQLLIGPRGEKPIRASTVGVQRFSVGRDDHLLWFVMLKWASGRSEIVSPPPPLLPSNLFVSGVVRPPFLSALASPVMDQAVPVCTPCSRLRVPIKNQHGFPLKNPAWWESLILTSRILTLG